MKPAVDFDRDIVPVYFALMNEARRYYRDERAQDLASEAVTRAIEHRDAYDGRPMLPWCRAIMRNLWVNDTGTLQSRNTVPLGEWDVAGGEAADQRTIVGQLNELVTGAVSSSVSVATLMEFASGRSVAEIAEASGIPVGTVKRRVHDGRLKLAKVLFG